MNEKIIEILESYATVKEGIVFRSVFPRIAEEIEKLYKKRSETIEHVKKVEEYLNWLKGENND